jgi:hypothetical protein
VPRNTPAKTLKQISRDGNLLSREASQSWLASPSGTTATVPNQYNPEQVVTIRANRYKGSVYAANNAQFRRYVRLCDDLTEAAKQSIPTVEEHIQSDRQANLNNVNTLTMAIHYAQQSVTLPPGGYIRQRIARAQKSEQDIVRTAKSAEFPFGK